MSTRRPWTVAEEHRLQAEVGAGTASDELVRLHDRTAGAIATKICRLALLGKSTAAPARPRKLSPDRRRIRHFTVTPEAVPLSAPERAIWQAQEVADATRQDEHGGCCAD